MSPSPDVDPTSSVEKNSGVARQVTASLIISLASLVGGLIQGWNSPATLMLKSEDSPVGPMTTQEIANLITIPSYFSIIIGVSLVYVVNTYGRKPSLVVASIPCAIGFLIIAFAKSQLWLYVGKLLSILSASAMGGGQLIVAESAHQSIRGVLLSVCTMQINVGILLAYVLGKLLSFQMFNIVIALVPAIFGVLVIWIPESPYFLVTVSKHEEAKKSLTWFRGGDIKMAEKELEVITKSSQTEEKEEVTLMQEWKQRATKVAVFVGFFAYVFQSFSGIHGVINFAALIFDEAGSPLSAEDSSIVTAVLNLAASFFNLFLIDMVGRRPLLFTSFIGGAISLTILSVFLYIYQNTGLDVSHLSWIPITSLSAFIFTYGLGLASVPGVLINELAPTRMRPVLGTLIITTVVFMVLGIVQSFPFIDDNIGLYFCFAVPAVFNAFGIIFTLFAVPETKGKSLAVIVDELNRKGGKNVE